MSKITFVLKKTGKGEERGVSIRHTHLGSEFTKATGVIVHPKYFNLATGKVSSKLPLAPEWNEQIQDLYTDIEKAARNILGWNEQPDKATISKEYNAIINLRAENKAKAPKTLAKVESMIDQLKAKLIALELEVKSTKQSIAEYENIFSVGTDNFVTAYIELYRNDKANKLSDSSKKLYSNVIHNLKLWKPNLKIQDVTKATFTDFEQFLLDKEKPLKNLSIRAIMVRLRNVVNINKSLLDNPESFQEYKMIAKRKSPTIVFLSKEELSELEDMTLNGVENHARNIFVFLSHTGLRWSDRNFDKSAIRNGVLTLKTQKTDTIVSIPLSNKAKELLKVIDFNSLSDRNFSRVIKKICSRMDSMNDTKLVVNYSGQDVQTILKPKYEMISAHSARRTFINLCLIAKTNPAVIRGWVGHNSLQMLMEYADKNANTKEEIANVFN